MHDPMLRARSLDESDYDSVAGITTLVRSLELFERLLEARRESGYVRKERLHEFVVLGRFYLDSCGNCMTWVTENNLAPKDRFPDIPDVLTTSAFWDFLKGQGLDEERLQCTGTLASIPPSFVRCHECRKFWTIGDCHDAVTIHREEILNLRAYVGRPLSRVKRDFRYDNEGLYRMPDECLVRNDQWIQAGNKSGRRGKQDGIGEEYVIQKGDEGFFNVWRFYHAKCQRARLAREQEQRFRKIFEKAGYRIVSIEAMVCGLYCCKA